MALSKALMALTKKNRATEMDVHVLHVQWSEQGERLSALREAVFIDEQGVDRELDGHDLVGGDVLFVEQLRARAFPARKIAVTPRIGIGYAEEWIDKPLRFHLKDNPHVSRPPRR